MSSQSATSVADTFSKLQVSQSQRQAKEAEPAESWEDEAEDSGSQTEGEGTSTPVRPSTSDLPVPPPPTPSDVNSQSDQAQPFDFGDAFANAPPSSRSGPAGGDGRRPDKTTSVASRLIAAGIGQKAPRRTKEEREYDQAMKIQEKKKRAKAREEDARRKREKESAQKAMWDD